MWLEYIVNALSYILNRFFVSLFLNYAGKSKNYYLYHDPKRIYLLNKDYEIVGKALKVKGKEKDKGIGTYSLIRKLFKSC